MKKKKIFISYDYDEDGHYKRLLEAWSKNNNIDIKFHDVSTDVSINSRDKDYIKRCISEDIKSCDIFVTLIGKDTHKCKWIEGYEIPEAFKLNKPIAGIRINKSNKIPESFREYHDLLIEGFKLEKILKLIEGKREKSELPKSLGIELKRIEC